MKIEFGKHINHTGRGDFVDMYGHPCHIAPSGGEGIHFGADSPHGSMYLDRPMVAALIPHLQAYVDTGSLMATRSSITAAANFESALARANALHAAADNLDDDFPEMARAFRELAEPTPRS